MRARMVDWMTDVLCQFKSEEKTMFSAVQIMDRYFKYCPNSLGMQDLHAIGVTAMYMASKIEDSAPLTLQKVHETIC
jgi:hypothetical protein